MLLCLKKKFLLLLLIPALYLPVRAQDAAVLAASALPLKQKTDSLLTLANRMKARGNFEVMRSYLTAAVPLLAELNDPASYLRYYAYAAVLYDIRREDLTLVAEMKKAYNYCSRVTDPEYKRVCLFMLAKGSWHQHQYDTAAFYFDQTEKLHNSFNPYLNWYVFAEKAQMYQDVEDIKLAESYFDKAIRLTREKGNRIDHGIMLNNVLTFYSYYKMPDKYAAMLREQADFIGKRKNPSMGPSIHDVMYSNLDKMNLDEKIQFLKNVKNTLEKQGDITNTTYVNIQIAHYYEDAGQFEKALEFINENMARASATGYYINQSIAAKTKYRLLTRLGRHSEAEHLFDYIFKLKDSLNLAEQQTRLQELEVKYQTDKKQQEIMLLNSRNELSEREIELLRVRTQNDSILLHTEAEKRKALFRENFLKELALDEQNKNNALLARQNSLKDSVVKQEQDYNNLLLSENILRRSELAKEQELKKSLENFNQLQSGKLEKEKQLRWGLAAGVSLLLLSGISLFIMYRKQRQKNAVIQKQSGELEVLMKEIHHRVKNNLQVVSSLLDLQGHSITDSQAQEAVKEGKNRVQSMALIHQNLYSEGNIKGILVKDYVHNLLQTLSDSYNITNDKVKISIDVDDLNLDVDTMIPLGLVLNELVSNSFKYAFRNRQNGTLHVQLKEADNRLHLQIRDNGSGFPDQLDLKNNKSFGLKMIRAFAQKLKAQLEMYNNNGAVVDMKIAKYKLA